MRPLLITGFGPFPGIPKNPSAALVRRMLRDPRLKRLGIGVGTRLIPTEYAAADHIVAALAAQAPGAVLMLGVAGRRRHLSLEIRARNRVSILHPDAAGRRPSTPALTPGGPAELRARAPLARLAVSARQPGLTVRLSRDAGDYLCNFAYRRMLEQLSPGTPCLFVHIPKLKGPRAMRRICDAAISLARGLARAAPSARTGSRPECR